MSTCTQKAPNLRCLLERRPTNTPRRHRLADGQLSSLYARSLSFSSFWRRLCDVVLFHSCLFEHTLMAVCVLPEYRSGRKYMRTSCDDKNVRYIFDPTCIVLKSGWNSTARMPRLVVSPSLPPSFPSSLQASVPPSVASTLRPSLLALSVWAPCFPVDR